VCGLSCSLERPLRIAKVAAGERVRAKTVSSGLAQGEESARINWPIQTYLIEATLFRPVWQYLG
jgi:hypothetical protein